MNRILTLIVLLVLPGCASVHKAMEDNEFKVYLGAKHTTLQIIDLADKPAERAQRIVNELSKIEDFIDSGTGEPVTLEAISGAVKVAINYGNLSIAKKAALDDAFMFFKTATKDSINLSTVKDLTGKIRPEYIEDIRKIIRIMKSAASLYLK